MLYNFRRQATLTCHIVNLFFARRIIYVEVSPEDLQLVVRYPRPGALLIRRCIHCLLERKKRIRKTREKEKRQFIGQLQIIIGVIQYKLNSNIRGTQSIIKLYFFLSIRFGIGRPYPSRYEETETQHIIYGDLCVLDT